MYNKQKLKWMVAEALLFVALSYLYSFIWDEPFKPVDTIVIAVLATLLSSLFWKLPAKN